MKELDFKVIGLKIKECRKALGITQESVAEYLEVNPSHISNIECGHANPSLTALVNIANTLQCSIDYFINGEYTYNTDKGIDTSLYDKILNKIRYCDTDKKSRILQIIDLL